MDLDNADIKIEISDDIMNKWQKIIDLIAQLFGVPSALIMRVIEEEIKVFLSSRTEGNPYTPGAGEHFDGSGLYCESVIKSRKRLLVPNAHNDENWKNNPDVKLNMISYMGFPIAYPDGRPFGTICVLDNKENHYSEIYSELMKNFRDIVEKDIELIYMNQILGEKNAKLIDYIREIQTLRGILPICSNCKKVRDDKGYWSQLERYIEEHSDAEFSYGLCSECEEKLYGKENWYKKEK